MTRARPLHAILLASLAVFSSTNARAACVAGKAPASQVSSTANQQAPEVAPSQTQEAAKEVKSYTLPPDLYKKAVEFSRARYELYFIDFVYAVIVLLLVLRWRLAPKYRDWVERASSRRFVQAAIYVPVLLLTLSVLALPTGIYGQWLETKYGISVQGWRSWAWDWTKQQLIAFVLGIILVWILYGVIRRSPRRWWFYFWLAALPIVIFVFFISPVVIDPLFFKYEPLRARDPALVAALEKVVERGGMNIPPNRMYEMKASEKLKALDAYVTGFGASKRVVVWDTTIAKMTVPQIAFVFGHEMGHYVLNHIPKLIAAFAAVLFVFLYLGYLGTQWALRHWGERWAIRGVDDWASLPVLFLLISIFSFVSDPITNSYSRHVEHQADVYGLEVTHGLTPNSRQVAAQAFQVLGEVGLADPDPNPFVKVWLYTHPPLGDRVQFALTYDPWAKGEQPEFVK